MMGPQKISERVEHTSKFYQLDPQNRIMKIWHFLHGSTLIAISGVLVGFSSLTYVAGYETKLFRSTLFFAIGFVGMCQPIVFYSKQRGGIPHLSDTVVKIAQSLERRSSMKQMANMRKITLFTRICFAIYAADISVMVPAYCVLPIYRRTLAVDMPFLPQSDAYFWSMYLVQSAILISGPVAVASIVFYHLEMSVCLSSLFRVLGEHFRDAVDKKDVKTLIDIHRLLLGASRTFVSLFSFCWFNLFCSMALIVMINTCVMLRVSFDVFLLAINLSLASILVLPCIWGDVLMRSSYSVGFSVYSSEWVYSMSDIRKELSLAILRSNQPVCIVAGMFGKLKMAKVLSGGKKWYGCVQALLSIE